MKKIHLHLLAVPLILILANSISTQAQTPAVQTAKKTSGGTGYLEHLPPDYATNTTRKYPVMFFLHGLGERGTGSASDLEKLKAGGPPKEMKNGHNMCFTVNGVEECFIVISPQLGTGYGGWWAGTLQGVFDYVLKGPENYRIDLNRVYLTGLSLGGNGVYTGLGATTDIFAAAAVIAGYDNGYGCTISARKIAVWGFHGESDGTIPYATGYANFQAITSCTSPVPTAEYKWVSYPGVGHNAWDRAFKPDHTYHNPNVYEWLLTKSKSSFPTANAGLDKGITLPTNSITLTGSGTDTDGTISSYLWEKITGGTAVITNGTTPTATMSGLVQGIYTFRLTVKDNSGNSSSDDVNVTVSPAAINVPPVITLATTLTLTLPTSSTNIVAIASDTDGLIASYLWTQQSGPSTATLTGTGTATLSASALVAGTYVFRLTATDDDAASSFKEISVVVNTAAVNQSPVALAGLDKMINLPTNNINLVGSGTDADGSIASYLWEKTAGPSATLATTTSPTLTLTNLVAGLYTFRLTVTDNKGATGTDEVNVSVVASNQSPTANAGLDIVITLPTSSTSIGGSGSDSDGSIASYLWSQTGGPSASTLTNSTNATVSVSNLIQGVYTYKLTVTDNLGATAIDEVKVTVNATPVNIAPAANAGLDQLVSLPVNSTILFGAGTDTDGTIVSYSWIRLSGATTVVLVNANTASLTLNELTPGSYSFQLTVTDNKGATGTDVVIVTVQPAIVNKIPIVDAGPDKGLTLPTNGVTLYGGGYDNDGTITFAWTKQSGPATFTFTNQNTNNLTLTNLVSGVYVFRLTVTDNQGATNFDEAMVTVASLNTAPTANAGQDILMDLPANSTSITGTGTDADGTISNYLWTYISGPSSPPLTNTTTNTLGVSGLVAGTYTFRLLVTDDDGATGWDEVKVTVNAANQIPVANAGGNQLITLPTTTINLNGFGTDTDGTIASYSWTQISGPAATRTNANNPTVSITVFSSSTYVFRLTVTDNSGNSDFDEMTLIVNPASVNQPPVAFAGENQSMTLPVNSIVLTGSGSDPDGSIASYQWAKVSGPDATLQNETTASLSLSNLLQAVYLFRLTVKDNGGLTSFSDVTVNVLPATVNQAPTAYAGEDQVLTLPTNSITLFGSGSDADGFLQSYTWEKVSGPAADVASETITDISFSNLVEGVYVFRLTVVDNKSSSGSDEVTITVNAIGVNQLPAADAGEDVVVNLPTSSINIEGSGSDADGTVVSYLWSKVSGPPVILSNTSSAVLTVSALVEGTYSFRLTVTDNDAATSTDDVTVQVLAASINQSPIVSAGDPVSIVLPVNNAKLTGTAFDPDGTIASYTWSKVSGGAATLQDENTLTLSLTDLAEGNYQFRLTATDNSGAIGSAEVAVEVKALGANVAPVADAGDDVTIKLPVNSVTLAGSGTDPDGTIASYLWEKLSGPDAVISNAGTSALSVSGMTDGTYLFQLSVTDNGGLKGTDEVKVVVLPQTFNVAPVANAGTDILLTLPENSVTLKGSGTDQDGSVTGYVWNKLSGPSATESGNTTSDLSLSSLVEGTYVYRLTVTDNSGSVNSDEVTIKVSPDPKSITEDDSPVAHAGPDQLLPVGTQTTQLIGSFEDKVIVDKFSWKQISGDPILLNGADSDTLVVSSLSKGTYVFELTVFNIFGKSGSDEVQITISDEVIVNYKKYFSPNGDGQNDFWELDPDITQFANCRLVIFDSKGNRLMTTESYQNNWDGNFNGKPLPEEAYYFVLECGGKKKSGSITLIR